MAELGSSAWQRARARQREAGRPPGETAVFLALLAVALIHDGAPMLGLAAAALAVFYGIPAIARARR